MATVLYRALNPMLRPRRAQLEVPGWAGTDGARDEGGPAQPWHCLPFTEAVRSCIELIFPHDDDVRVSTRAGQLCFDGDFGEDEEGEERRPPFHRFGSAYYAYQLRLDIKPPDGFSVRIDPHPRMFTDTSGQVPIAVPALIRPSWPMINFLVFKTPRPGEEHVFRPGEGMAAITLVQPLDRLEVVPMHDQQVAEREQMLRGLRGGGLDDYAWASHIDRPDVDARTRGPGGDGGGL